MAPRVASSGPSLADVLLNIDFTDINSLKLALSKLLGLGVVFGASVVRVPQVLSLYRAKNATGVSAAMFALELLSYTISLAFCYASGFPFSTFGETLFMAIQNIMILALIFKYTPRLGLPKLVLPGMLYVLFAGVLLSGQVPLEYLSMAYSGTIGLTISSRLPQIYSNYRNKGCGKLNPVSTSLMFMGSVARVFTTVQETNSNLMLVSMLLATFLNGVLFLQIIMYGEGKKKD